MLRKVLKSPWFCAIFTLIVGFLTGWYGNTSFGNFDFVPQPLEQMLHAAQLGFIGWVSGGLDQFVFPFPAKAPSWRLFLIRWFIYFFCFASFTLFLVFLLKTHWQNLLILEAINDWLAEVALFPKWVLLCCFSAALAGFYSFSYGRQTTR